MFERNRIGDTLRSAREKRGLSLEQAASAAGIPTPYLRLLEGETNVSVGVSDELYLIPFFRKYARFVELDPEEMLPEFLGMVQQMPGEGSPSLRLSYRPRYASLWRPLAILLTIGIATTLLLRQTRERPAFEDLSSSERSAAIALADATTKGVAVTPEAATGEPVATPSATASSSLDHAATASTASTGPHSLTIAAKGDAWLSVALDDEPAKQYLLRAGESRTWSAGLFSLMVGNAGGIVLSLDGRELPSIGRPGQVVRNLRFPEAAPSPSPTRP
jgi:cytoskeleton protein RodZ